MKNHVNAYQIQGLFRTLPNIYNGAICKNSNYFYQFIISGKRSILDV